MIIEIYSNSYDMVIYGNEDNVEFIMSILVISRIPRFKSQTRGRWWLLKIIYMFFLFFFPSPCIHIKSSPRFASMLVI